MALSASALSALMRTNLLAINPPIVADGDELTAMCDALAAACVTHITAAAVVLPTALIAPGGMSPAPVTGTGSIQ